ncbi:MAG: FAD-dependent oxidoreductase, partial [Kiritimatiellae bacterium]|nr:FAD-dependent oxidoreductase [Kiritimatiellia bacterium]
MGIDSNNRTGFSSDFIGKNWAWPEASYEERERIFRAHLEYQRGLMWTLANHPRIPENVRTYFSKWGTCRDEFADGPGDGWQSQLYVREARRMIGETVMTEHHCRGAETVKCPVAMAAYTMDSHHVRRLVTAKGFVRNEGNVEDRRSMDPNVPMKPYGIDYGAVVPKKSECVNLIVPVCLSASHIAFGSIRMEPVFFALGQVAGTAAAQAIDAGCAVQDVPYDRHSARLLADGQVISKDIQLDLNGHDLTNVTVPAGVTLYGIDSATDGYAGSFGTLSGKIEGTVAATVKTAAPKSYVALCEDGSWSFHRYYASITTISLNPAQAALGYKAEFYGDKAVKNAVVNYGYALWVNDYAPKTFTVTDKLEKNTLTLRLKNILRENNDAVNAVGSTATIGGKAFITLKLNGEEVTLSGTEQATTLRQTLEAVNANTAAYSENALQAVRSFCTAYANWMTGWT